jgi:hypothetical protein
MAIKSIPPDTIYENLTHDFEAAWNGIARSIDLNVGRGNFLFAFLSTLLLEWICRVCTHDASGIYIGRMAKELEAIDPLYFTELAHCSISPPQQFKLPITAGKKGPILLWALFDLIRNGQAHQYQQIPAQLSHDRYLWIAITGADKGTEIPVKARPSDHLGFCSYRDGNVGIKLYPQIFFTDISAAIRTSGVLESNLTHEYLKRDYRIDADRLITKLQDAGHLTFDEKIF